MTQTEAIRAKQGRRTLCTAHAANAAHAAYTEGQLIPYQVVYLAAYKADGTAIIPISDYEPNLKLSMRIMARSSDLACERFNKIHNFLIDSVTKETV